MRKTLLVLILLIIVAGVTSCRKDRKAKSYHYSGKIVDAYDQKGIEGIHVYIADEDRNFSGGRPSYYDELSEIDTTDSNGTFLVSTDLLTKVCPYFIIKQLPRNLPYTYSLYNNNSIYPQGHNDNFFGKRELSDERYENEVIELMRHGFIRIDFIKNPNQIDTVRVGIDALGRYTITQDTSYYLMAQPNQINTVICKKNDSTIWQQDFTIGIKGDTVVGTITL